jgi:predicted RNA-binding Zn-ribbon protein involved in translation (DUF1610 family)
VNNASDTRQIVGNRCVTIRPDNCARCGWPLPLDGWTMQICPECNRTELFKLAARIAGRAIMTEKNWLLRLQLIRKFFGVVVNVWEKESILGSVHSVTRR